MKIVKQNDNSDSSIVELMKSSIYKSAFKSLKHPNFDDKSIKRLIPIPQLQKV
jgi:hypothetical protein